MSMPPAPPPEPSHAPAPAVKKQRSALFVGLMVGVLVVAVGGVSFAGVRVIDKIRTPDPIVSGPATTATPTPTPSATPTAVQPPTSTKLARFYDQKLSWSDCDGNQCATLLVPLDYAAPQGRTIKLAVLKAPAGDPSKRIGSLVVNPGGPGGSGVDFATSGSSQFGDVLVDRYDIVGFDPRGVGQSDPIKCGTTQQLDNLLGYDPDPDTAAERTELDRLAGGFGAACLKDSGALLSHISTKEAARDMDILRAALGEAKLDYLGSSYGTFLGATYAEEFPKRVGRFVLDGAIDPSLSNEKLALGQARGFETALRAYVQDCVDKGSCFLGSTVDAGTKRIRKFLDQVSVTPLVTDESRKLTDGWATLGIFLPLYVKSYWPLLTNALQEAFDKQDGSGLLTLADAYASRGEDSYDDNSIAALYAVNCLDHDDYIATSAVPSHFADFEKASPTFGRTFAYGLSTCSVWPVKNGAVTTALHAKGAPPIIVIGTTRDPATPLVWAQGLAAQLDSGRLITRDGDGHTGFQRGNTCVDDAVEGWLVDGKDPGKNLMC